MLMKVIPFVFLITGLRFQNPMAVNPAFDSYNDVFSRGAKNPGFWGAVGPNNSNVFDNKWNSDGYQQMYNLNSQSPMAGSRANGYDTTTTMFNKYGPTSFEVIPVQSNFMPQSSINAYTYDLNEPRMAAIYKNYMRFMNKNLDRLQRVTKDNTDFSDLNRNDVRKLKNPHSFQYKNEYFDGQDAQNSLPTYYHQRYTAIPQKSSITQEERRLSQKKPNEADKALAKMKRLEKKLDKVEKKLDIFKSMATPVEAKKSHRLSI